MVRPAQLLSRAHSCCTPTPPGSVCSCSYSFECPQARDCHGPASRAAGSTGLLPPRGPGCRLPPAPRTTSPTTCSCSTSKLLPDARAGGAAAAARAAEPPNCRGAAVRAAAVPPPCRRRAAVRVAAVPQPSRRRAPSLGRGVCVCGYPVRFFLAFIDRFNTARERQHTTPFPLPVGRFL